jgi:hypothetical protein
MHRALFEQEQGQHDTNNAIRVAMGQLAPSYLDDNGSTRRNPPPSSTRLTHNDSYKRPKLYHETCETARWNCDNAIGLGHCRQPYSDGSSRGGHMDYTTADTTASAAASSLGPLIPNPKEQNCTHNTGLWPLSSSHIARRVSFSPTVTVKNTYSSSTATAKTLLGSGIQPVSLEDPLWARDYEYRCISPVGCSTHPSSYATTRAMKSSLAPTVV